MGTQEWGRHHGLLFDSAAEEYDKARRSYPDVLVDRALERGGLGAGSRVVEVGSGTGKLTAQLVERGLRVDAVDPGPNMIEVARRRVGPGAAVEFHVGRFEDVELPEGAFGGVFAATAFHWVDPEIGWAKAASLLGPGGVLALLSHLTVRDEESAEVYEALIDVLREHEPELAADWPKPRELDAILGGVPTRAGNASATWDWLMGTGRHRMEVAAAAELFDDVEVVTETEVIEETADELIEHFRTTSLCHRLEPERREALLDADRRVLEQFGGTMRSSLVAVVMTARKRARS
jgi:SAM-dependent methyltransferase